jgi:hypothetical protein
MYTSKLAVPDILVTYAILADLKGCYLNINSFYLFMYFGLIDAFIYMPEQMVELIAVSCPVGALLWPYALDLIGFKAVLKLLQQIKKYKVVYILAYLPRLELVVSPDGKSGLVSGNSMDHFEMVV